MPDKTTHRPKGRKTGKCKAVLRWYGGKRYLLPKILSLVDGTPHRIYVEPYGGGAVVLLNKQPSPVEVYNDIDGRLVRLFRVLRDHPEKFFFRLALTPYAEGEWERCAHGEESGDEIEQARRDFVAIRQSFAGLGKAFSYSVKQSRRGMAQVVSGYLSAVADIPIICQRLMRVQIFQRDALDVIRLMDSPETLFYLDPPYLPETVTKDDAYACMMTVEDHERMLDAILRVQGKVILSGYESGLYNSRLSGWKKIRCNVACHVACSARKPRREEILWCNFDIGEVADG